MLSFSPPSTTTPHSWPTRMPSPLRPSSPQTPPRTAPRRQQQQPAQKLAPNTLLSARRDTFLRSVRTRRAAASFEKREAALAQLDRLEDLRQRRSWEATLLRSAPEAKDDEDGAAGAESPVSAERKREQEEAERVALQEEREMQALLALMPRRRSDFGEDEEMDGLFEGVALEGGEQGERMDTGN